VQAGDASDAEREVIEQVLVAVWKEVLRNDAVTPEHNFFDLGGHSLLAMQVHLSIIEALGVEVPMRLQFNVPNLRALAKGIHEALAESAAAVESARAWLASHPEGAATVSRPEWGRTQPAAPEPSPSIPVSAQAGGPLGPPTATAPASFNQQRLWFLDQLEPGSAFYNLHMVLKLPGYLNRGAFHRALAEVVARHESLRTTFAADESGEPVQVIHAPGELPLPFDDLRAFTPQERAAAVERLVLQDAHTPFDLARGPLLRMRLLHRTDDEHLLVMVLHHIVVDAWSVSILMREIQTLYQAFATGRPSPLPPLERQYRDFALWQREILQGKNLERLVSYWKGQLAGAPPVLELPTDRPRPALQSFSGAMLFLELDPEVAAGVAELSRHERSTPFMVLLAAFASLLSRYARQEDVVVGSPITNRHLAELAPLIGFFTNTLVLRVDLSGDPSFADLVRRVRSTTVDALDHQELPFERLVDELQPERNLSHNPLFQVLFSFDINLGPQLDKLRGDDLPEVHSGTSKFDLGLYTFHTEGGGLGGAFEYNTDLFDRRRIEAMVEHLKSLLGAGVSAPDTPLSQIGMLTAAEREELLALSRPASVVPAQGCAHELFARQAELFPDEVAASFGGSELTFNQLDRAANRLAHLLRREGVGPDVRVGLCVERSLDLLVALLGILKAGGAYVPIDPNYPGERVTYMLEDAAVSTLLTETAVADRLPSVPGVNRLCLDQLVERLAGEPETVPETGVALDDLAYTIYTSGSTGRPKGVAMTHRAVADLVVWQARQPYFGGGGRTLQFTSLSFDVSFQEIFATWLAGGQMVMITEDDRRDPERLARILDEQRIERLFQPFVAVQQLCEVLAQAPQVPSALRLIVTAGEQLQVTPQVARAFARLPRGRLFNQYGPSETHIVTEEPVPGVTRGEPALPPIGKPIAGATAYVLDPHLRLQPAGVPGELYIGGTAVARGYLNRPELTAERFLPDPFCGQPGARMYRTGDVARMLPGGSIQFEGRVDDQVKIRGFRVEPGEVESVFRRHPAVREAVVVVRPDAGGEKRLVAYYITEDGSELAEAEAREFLRERLPDYMLPSLLLKIDVLPLTPSGKINRRALPQPDFGVRRVTDAYVAPGTPLEQALADIFKGVLAVEQVGAHDSFFELGGHSLLATRVVARVREEMGVSLTVRLIFEAPTVTELALAICKLEAESADESYVSDLVQRLESLGDQETAALLQG
jgi:amino acid adenylation domain-containing protein